MGNHPKYDPNDVKNWLTKVFGHFIIFDTSRASVQRNVNGEKDNSLGAWTLYHTGELYLVVDLPPGQSQLLTDKLRKNLERAMHAALVPKHWNTPVNELKKAVRNSGWPLPEDVIPGNLHFDTALLKELATHMEKPAEYARDFAKDVQATEAEWIERKAKLLRRCAVAFIGCEHDGSQKWHFHYGDISHLGGNMEVALLLPALYPPVFSGHDAEGNEFIETYDWQNHWANRSYELGLDGAFRYQDFHIGTHAPIEEQKLILQGRSDMDISNKMDVLLDPANLPNAQLYFNEVLGSTLTEIWLNDCHPDFISDLQHACDGIKGASKEAVSRRRKISENLGKGEKYVQWKEVVPKLITAYPRMDAFIQALRGPVPQGQEAVYDTLRTWAEKTFPLLTKSIIDNRAAPVANRHASPKGYTPTV